MIDLHLKGLWSLCLDNFGMATNLKKMERFLPPYIPDINILDKFVWFGFHVYNRANIEDQLKNSR